MAPEWNHQQPAAKSVAMSKWSTQHGTGFLASAPGPFQKGHGNPREPWPRFAQGTNFPKGAFQPPRLRWRFLIKDLLKFLLGKLGNWETHSPCFSQKKRGSPCILFNSGNGGFEANLKIWKSPLFLVAFGSWHTADHFFYEPCTAGATLPVNPWDKPFVGTTITGMPRHMKVNQDHHLKLGWICLGILWWQITPESIGVECCRVSGRAFATPKTNL